MKKTSLFLCALIFSLSSCSNDDGDNNNSAGQISVDGNNYTVTDAKAVDNFNFYSETHAEYDFVLASKTITIDAEPGTSFGFTTENAKFALNLGMYSLGTTFQNGVYQFDENFDFEEPDFNFFDTLTIYIDGNENGEYFDDADDIFYVTAGTVTVSGSGPNYVLAFDVTMDNGQELNFTYNGGFDYVDNRND